MPRAIEADDIYRIEQPGECVLSPNGERVAVVLTTADKETLKYHSRIWMVPTNGGEPRRFTEAKAADHHPRFTPDGKTLVFLSSRSGKSQVWSMPVDGGEARQVTRLEGNVGDFAISPDGKRLAIVYNPQDAEQKELERKKKLGEPGSDAVKVRTIERVFYKLDGAGFMPKNRSHLWMVDLAGGRARQLTKDDRYDESHPVFSPDGRWLYFQSNRTADPDFDLDRVDIWRMPARGGAIARVPTFAGPSSDFSLSPDGRWIAFLGYADPGTWNTHHTKLWLVPAEGGRPVELTERLDRGCENSTISDTYESHGNQPPAWSPDSQWVYFQVSTQGNVELWRVHVRERKPVPILDAPGVVLAHAIDFRSGTLYASFGSTRDPGELIAYRSLRGRTELRPLTKWNAWLRDRLVAEPEELWFHGKGSHRLQGWILRPRRRTGRRGPGILYIHGGPAAQYGRTFFHEFQYLAARGYTVFYCNPRGGTGYSEKHLAAIHDAWGTIDYEDVMSFTDEVLRRSPQVDRRRVGVAGGSYGGYMTNWIIGHTDRFSAAVTQRSVVNLMSFLGTSDFGYAWPRAFSKKPAWSDAEHYLRMSPITYVDAVRTPTLIEHQEHDDRCPVEQAEQLFAALKARKVPAEFHRYPDESHGMSRIGRPDRRIERLARIDGWFGRWLSRRRPGRK